MEADLITGCVTAFFVFVSPIIAFCLVGSVVRYAPYGYVFTLVTSALWVVYGLDWGLAPLLWLNATGAALAAVYIGLFLWRSDAADRRRTYLLRLIVGGAALLVGAFCIDLFLSKAMYGCMCSVVSWVASVAPFYKIRTVWRNKNMDAMPPLVTPAIGLINASIWTGRNTLRLHNFDLNLVVASGVAAFFALVQVVLHAWFFFRRQPPPPRTGVREPFIQAEDGKDGSDKESVGGEKSAKSTDDDADQTESSDANDADQTESSDDDDADQTESSDADDADQTESTDDDDADDTTESIDDAAAEDHTENTEDDTAAADNKVNARDGDADDDLRLDVRSSSSDGERPQPHDDETDEELQEKRFQHIVDVPAAASTEVRDVDTA